MSVVRRVLLVDDDDLIREVAQTTLELVAGWDVLVASHGAEAIEVACRELPDAVLMDVMMPFMDGPTAFVKLQADERTRDIPVILLTAKVQSGDRQQWKGLDIAGVITKPFDPMRLATTIEQLLGWDGEQVVDGERRTRTA